MTLHPDHPPALVDPLAALLDERERESGARADPLARTALEVEIRRGLATVTTTRTFRNEEDEPVEALLTFPVPSTAVLFRLRTVVAGREIRAIALPKGDAESAYEEARESGAIAARHEERNCCRGSTWWPCRPCRRVRRSKFRGHWTTPLQRQGPTGRLRVPMTIGRGLGPVGPDSPDEAGEPRTDGAPGTARLRVECDGGRARVNGEATPVAAGGAAGAGSFEVQAPTDAPVDLEVADGAAGAPTGEAADGRIVTMRIEPAGGLPFGDEPDLRGVRAPAPGRSRSAHREIRGGLRRRCRRSHRPYRRAARRRPEQPRRRARRLLQRRLPAAAACRHVGLAFARAAAVARRIAPLLEERGYLALALSAGQTLLPGDGGIADGSDPGDNPARRTIEIRLRRRAPRFP